MEVVTKGDCRVPLPENFRVISDLPINVIECKDPSLTRQSEAAEADINVLVQRFGVGEQPPAGGFDPVDVSPFQELSYMEMLNRIREAGDSFMQLPARVRSRFDNDPDAFVKFCSDPSNVEEAITLGIAMRRVPVEEPVAPVPVV